MSKRKTHEEYVAELAIKNPSVEAMEKYSGNKTKVLHRCKKHNVSWYMLPNNALKGCKCAKCKAENGHNIFTKTHTTYVEEVRNINPDIIVLDKYVTAKTPILHKCKIDGYEWNTTPTNILSGQGCPECAKRSRIESRLKSHEQYIQELSEIAPTIEVIGKYIDSHTKILHHCVVCNYYWEVNPNNTLNGCGCPICAGTAQKTHDEYVKQASLINPDIVILGKYINARTPILHKCKIDGNEWMAMPDKILHGQGCPQCNESQGERAIRQWLDAHNIRCVYQKSFSDCKDIKPLPFDFYLPDHNVLIEYDGKQHYEPISHFGGEQSFNRTKRHDNIKTEYCKNNNINLLRIPYFKDVDEELNNFLFI